MRKDIKRISKYVTPDNIEHSSLSDAREHMDLLDRVDEANGYFESGGSLYGAMKRLYPTKDIKDLFGMDGEFVLPRITCDTKIPVEGMIGCIRWITPQGKVYVHCKPKFWNEEPYGETFDVDDIVTILTVADDKEISS